VRLPRRFALRNDISFGFGAFAGRFLRVGSCHQAQVKHKYQMDSGPRLRKRRILSIIFFKEEMHLAIFSFDLRIPFAPSSFFEITIEISHEYIVQ